MKYDLPNSLIDEWTQFQILFALGNTRTSTGSGTFTSTTSSTSYPYTGGQNDLFNQLQTVLNPYLITASDFNLGFQALRVRSFLGV